MNSGKYDLKTLSPQYTIRVPIIKAEINHDSKNVEPNSTLLGRAAMNEIIVPLLCINLYANVIGNKRTK